MNTIHTDSAAAMSAIVKGNLVCKNCGEITVLQNATALEPVACSHCQTLNIAPKILNKFALYALLRDDNTGCYYKAYHEEIPSRYYAVKIIPPEKSTDSSVLEKLHREADISNRIGRHMSIFYGVEFGNQDDEWYLASEYKEGVTLEENLKNTGTLSEFEVMLIADRLLAAANHIHRAGFLYRDFQPRNIQITDSEGAYIWSLNGIASIEEAQTGASKDGSPLFMSPEQLAGKPEDVTSTIYSLGLLLYYLLTGKNFYMTDEIEKMQHDTDDETVALDTTNAKMSAINSSFGQILARMIAANADNRYQRYSAVEHDITKLLMEQL